jgi:O-antigen ligase
MRNRWYSSPRIYPTETTNRCASLHSRAYLTWLCLLLMFGVLAFGAVEIWAMSILEISAALLCTMVVVDRICFHGMPLQWNPLFPPMLGFAAVLALQLMFNLTAYRYVTLLAFMQYIAYGALLFSVTQLELDERSSNLLVLAFVVFGSGVALFAICQSLGSTPHIYWLRSPQVGAEFFGPYFNRNHYAGMMEMLTPFALVVSFSGLIHGGQRVLAAFAAVVMAASIALSLSRGGAIALLCELFLSFWIISAIQNRGLVRAWMLLLAACGFLFLVFIGSPAMWSHLEDMHETFRPELFRDSLRMLAQKPILGWGFGTFPTVYPVFRSFYTTLFVNAAHDDYLQVLVETGTVGFSFVVWFMVVLYGKGLPLCRDASTSWRGVLRLATLVGCTGVAVHSGLDFNLQIPANAALFFVFCALATSLSKDKPSTLPFARSRVRLAL